MSSGGPPDPWEHRATPPIHRAEDSPLWREQQQPYDWGSGPSELQYDYNSRRGAAHAEHAALGHQHHHEASSYSHPQLPHQGHTSEPSAPRRSFDREHSADSYYRPATAPLHHSPLTHSSSLPGSEYFLQRAYQPTYSYEQLTRRYENEHHAAIAGGLPAYPPQGLDSPYSPTSSPYEYSPSSSNSPLSQSSFLPHPSFLSHARAYATHASPHASRPAPLRSESLPSSLLPPTPTSPIPSPDPPRQFSSDPSPTHQQILLHLSQLRHAFDAALFPLASPTSISQPSVSFLKRGPRATKPTTASTSSSVLPIDGQCWTCAANVARLNLRGVDWATVDRPPRMRFTCGECVGGDAPPPDPGPLELGGVEAEVPGTYRDTLSAALDVLQGIALSEISRPLVPLYTPRKSGVRNALRCDICTRVVGALERLSDASPPRPFTTEAICDHCIRHYKPCSDCGGGGGRLSHGRWRCIELFPEGRKNCTLSHARLPPIGEREFNVLRISEIPPLQLPGIKITCRQLYLNARMSALARPEHLEKGDGLATSFREADRLSVDQWSMISLLLDRNDESTSGFRRFLGFQSSAPRPRNKVSRSSVPVTAEPIRTGFMLIEHDLTSGTLLLVAVAPWATSGHGWESTTILGETMLQSVRHALATTNAARHAQGQPAWPEPTCTWIAHPFRREGKIHSDLERHGYVNLADVPDSSSLRKEWFPPHRDFFIPQAYLTSWKICVRPIPAQGDDHTMGGDGHKTLRMSRRRRSP